MAANAGPLNFISVDDHVLEPPDLWSARMPGKYRGQGPRVERQRGLPDPRTRSWTPAADAPGAIDSDVWIYDDMVWPLIRGYAMSGYEHDDALHLITYDDVLPGTYQREARLADLDRNRTDASLCYPSVTRFCGQIFLERADKEVAHVALQVFNDWIIDEWAGKERPARLLPMTLVPLWDAELAAAEVRRCADKGSHAIAFSECPPALGLPSIFSGYWDPLFQACDETETVIDIHVGSSSKLLSTADDAPADMTLCLTYVNSMLAFSDWLYAGIFEHFPNVRLVMAESQAGWMPFATQRIDNTWKKGNEKFHEVAGLTRRASALPSTKVAGHIFACIFDDVEGLKARNTIGLDQLLVETDYPHADSTFPHSMKTFEEMTALAGMNEAEVYKFFRGNAIVTYRLDTYFGITA